MTTRHDWTPPTQDLPHPPPPPPRMVAGRTVTAVGLDPEQEIRAEALQAASRIIAPAMRAERIINLSADDLDVVGLMAMRLADDLFVPYIRDGSRPDTAEEATTHA